MFDGVLGCVREQKEVLVVLELEMKTETFSCSHFERLGGEWRTGDSFPRPVA